MAEHKSAVGRSDESGNTCPNFWHFSPYGFCPDGMALDPVTGYSRVMIPFFARHPLARLRVLSKSADFDNVLDLDHRGHTVLCWSLNPPAVRDEYETVTPAVTERVRAAERCAAAGYPVRVMLMPVIPVPNWERHYDEFLEDLLARVPVDRLTIGGVCSYGPALDITGRKVGADDLLSRSLTVIGNSPGDGRARYPYKLRRDVYAHLLGTIRRVRPQQTVALCMEDPQLAADLGVADNIGRCNCIL